MLIRLSGLRECFCAPHHFQQAENYLEGYMRNWGQAHSGCFWGFLTLDLDQTLLRQGKIALNAASGIMPDGTPFRFAGAQQAPAPLAIAENKTGENVVLALPTYRAGREDVIFQESPEALARYLAYENEVDDLNAVSVGSAALQFGRLRLRLMLESELNAEWTALGVTRVLEKRGDNSLRLDTAQIPPMLNCQGNPVLKTFINDLQGLLQQRSQQMSQRLLQPGRGGSSGNGRFHAAAADQPPSWPGEPRLPPRPSAPGASVRRLAAVRHRARQLLGAAHPGRAPAGV